MLPLRVVVDTNVVVSALLKPEGLQRTVVVLALRSQRDGTFLRPFCCEYDWCHVAASSAGSPFCSAPLDAAYPQSNPVVTPKYRLHVTSDPDDNIFVECADAARADYLVTGNVRHFPEFWKATKVISSREFLGIAGPHLLR